MFSCLVFFCLEIFHVNLALLALLTLLVTVELPGLTLRGLGPVKEGGREGQTGLGVDTGNELGRDPVATGQRATGIAAVGLDGAERHLNAVPVARRQGASDLAAIDENDVAGAHTGGDMCLSAVLDADAAGNGQIGDLTVHVLDLIASSTGCLHAAAQSETRDDDTVLEEGDVLLDVVPVDGRGALVLLGHALSAGLRRGPMRLLRGVGVV